MSQGHFERASFHNTNLVGASLTGASFAGADFSGAVLLHANLVGADLSGARGLTQEQLDTACTSSATRLPAGLVSRACHGDPPHVIVLRAGQLHGGAPRYVIEGSPP